MDVFLAIVVVILLAAGVAWVLPGEMARRDARRRNGR